MLFVGITGGVGAGKSSILNYLGSNYKCRVLMTDNMAQDIKRTDKDCIDRIREICMGEDVYNEDGSLDNKKLARVVFADKDKREKLNALIHPKVINRMLDIYREEKGQGSLDILVVESAILFESGIDNYCDESWYIYASEEVRRERLKKSRSYEDDKINNIFATQLSEQKFRELSNYVIDNNSIPEKAFKEIDAIMIKHGVSKV